MRIEISESFLDFACKNDVFNKIVEEYVLFCRDQKEEPDGKLKKGVKQRGRFPNVAGLCRYLGIGDSDFERLRKKYPREVERACAILEDEALNSDVSPTVISAYFKRRLGYDKQGGGEICDGGLRVIFDHDIIEDGE